MSARFSGRQIWSAVTGRRFGFCSDSAVRPQRWRGLFASLLSGSALMLNSLIVRLERINPFLNKFTHDSRLVRRIDLTVSVLGDVSVYHSDLAVTRLNVRTFEVRLPHRLQT